MMCDGPFVCCVCWGFKAGFDVRLLFFLQMFYVTSETLGQTFQSVCALFAFPDNWRNVDEKYLYNRDQSESFYTRNRTEGQENSCLFYRWTPVKHKSVQDLSLFLLSLSDNGVMTRACGSDSTKTDWDLMSLFAGTEIVDRKSVQQERMCSYHSERQRPP